MRIHNLAVNSNDIVGNSAESPGAVRLDIGRIIDDGPFTRFQKTVALLAAAAVIMDGFDGQLIGFAIPVIAQEWSVARSTFAPVVAAGLLGMGIGSACAGIIGDRFGRRVALVGSVLMFGIATSVVGLAPNLFVIGMLRFFAGLGLGGALPTATTFVAEFAPRRRRTVAITATIVCVPLGGMLAGLFSGYVLPHSGWRPLFLVGGAFPVFMAILLMFNLPESPRFLARRRERWAELSSILGRFGVRPPAEAVYCDEAEQVREQHYGLSSLLAPDYRRDSVALWSAFFLSMLTIYSAFSWLPTMLVSSGLSTAVASAGLTAYNAGGVLGALLCAMAIARYGSRIPLLLCCLAGAISALMLTQLGFRDHSMLLIFGLGVHGLFVNAVQSTMFALCAYVYSTSVRATGTATAAMFGRLGAVTSSFAGAAAIASLGPSGYLAMLGLTMLLVLAALAAIRHHLPSVMDGKSH
ncbi:MAG TPA: MFS transporter [Terriglobales bacterium]|nr:MFS transporter [Terriglobales bacterium]